MNLAYDYMLLSNLLGRAAELAHDIIGRDAKALLDPDDVQRLRRLEEIAVERSADFAAAPTGDRNEAE